MNVGDKCQIDISELMCLADHMNEKGVLTYLTSHCVYGQHSHSITLCPLCFTLMVFRRYYVSEANFGAPKHSGALFWSYVVTMPSSGDGMWPIFGGKAVGSSEITALKMIRFSLPVWATHEYIVHTRLDHNISGSSNAMPRICATDICWTHCQQRPTYVVLPIIEAYTEASPEILSLSFVLPPSTIPIQNLPVPENFVKDTS